MRAKDRAALRRVCDASDRRGMHIVPPSQTLAHLVSAYWRATHWQRFVARVNRERLK